jgi:hypothetical protein
VYPENQIIARIVGTAVVTSKEPGPVTCRFDDHSRPMMPAMNGAISCVPHVPNANRRTSFTIHFHTPGSSIVPEEHGLALFPCDAELTHPQVW